MKENELEVLDQYDIDVKSTRKVRGAILCEANQGTFLLKEMNFSEKRIPTLYALYQHLHMQGYRNIDMIIKNKDGELLAATEAGTKYLLKGWFHGKECDNKREQDILDGVQNLALLHRIMKVPYEDMVYKEDLQEEFLRHNREMKKVRTFIRNKVGKGEFELVFLKHFDMMFEWAEAACERLQSSGYRQLLEQNIKEGAIAHGDYNYHNVLITPAGIATTNFEHFHQGIQLSDFYYFLRKTMEKNQWNVELGAKMVECYNRILPLSQTEVSYLAVCIAYPEKYWKAANSYYRSRKSWISAKSLEKLQLAIKQTEQKKLFLETVFSFYL